MFRWTVMRRGDDADLARDRPPAGLLSGREREVLAGLAFAARRRKWLLGRWAAKKLIREAIAARDGAAPPADAITVANEPSGAPYAELAGVGRIPWTLSLSHRDEAACAVLSGDEGARIGADLEMVVARGRGLVRDFFTDEEAAVVRRLAGREAELAVARTWSAKEAVLKAMRLGLRVDTRRVVVVEEPLSDGRAPAGWRALSACVVDAGVDPSLPRDYRVFWRDQGDYVITVAVPVERAI